MNPKRPRVSMSDTDDHEVSSSRWIHETVKGSHEFKIEGYSLAKGMGVGKPMTSAKFTVAGYDWVVLFYPDGDVQASEKYVSLFVGLANTNTNRGDVRALFELKLEDQSGEGKYGVIANSISPRTFNTVRRTWGCTQYIKRSELETSSYLKDDCLSIHCTVGVVQTRVEEEKPSINNAPPSDLFQNLKGFLESETGFDITFQVGNEFFRAHKLVLASQSPVFKAQFYGLVGNPDMKTEVIEELDPSVFKAMLLYLYSNELPETRELSDSDSLCTSDTMITQHLLAAAERFGIARLKLLCEAKLGEELTANTVATTLSLADQYDCPQLKTVCLKFAAKPENLGEFIKSDGYAYLEKSRPSLLTEVLKLMERKKVKPNPHTTTTTPVAQTLRLQGDLGEPKWLSPHSHKPIGVYLDKGPGKSSWIAPTSTGIGVIESTDSPF